MQVATQAAIQRFQWQRWRELKRRFKWQCKRELKRRFKWQCGLPGSGDDGTKQKRPAVCRAGRCVDKTDDRSVASAKDPQQHEQVHEDVVDIKVNRQRG